MVIHYRSSREDAEATANAVRDEGRKAWLVQADLAEPGRAESLFSEAVDLAGPIDLLVNSASIFPAGTVDDLSEKTLFENLQVNTLAPFILSRRLYEQERSGCIVNLLDTRIVDYDRKHVPYHLSKRTLFSITRMLSVEYAPRVRVNSVAPGLILPPPGEDESFLERMAHTNPLHTHGTAGQIALSIVFLMWNEFVTGQVLFVDGGRHLKGSTYGA